MNDDSMIQDIASYFMHASPTKQIKLSFEQL